MFSSINLVEKTVENLEVFIYILKSEFRPQDGWVRPARQQRQAAVPGLDFFLLIL